MSARIVAAALALVALLLRVVDGASDKVFVITLRYFATDDSCSQSAPFLKVNDEKSCSASTCVLVDNYGYHTSTVCVNDFKAYLECMSGQEPYFVHEKFNSGGMCTDGAFRSVEAYPATGDCVMYSSSINKRVVLEANGSVSIYFYDGHQCDETTFSHVSTVDENIIADSVCYFDEYSIYDNKYSIYRGNGGNTECVSDMMSDPSANNPAASSEKNNARGDSSANNPEATESTDTGSNLGAGAYIGITIAGAAVVAFIVATIIWKKRHNQLKSLEGENDTGRQDGHVYQIAESPGAHEPTGGASRSSNDTPPPQGGLWTDDVVTAARIPRDSITVSYLLGSGTFRHVYFGVYGDKQVVVKMLRPEKSKSIVHINDFLIEVKLAAAIQHPHIVRFEGVTWTSLTDLCSVQEFMHGGDLRSLLDNLQSEHEPIGFDRSKITIACQVCQALVYLHSQPTPVVHCDLKSRSIVLSHELVAKLSDPGVSRKRLARTLTTAVGTPLWMAPEVVKGENFDGKADMFSFGVVLSELDMHVLPYATAREREKTSVDRSLDDTAVLQQVVMGKTNVAFSDVGPLGMAKLGRDCTRVDPAGRPTSTMALYRLQAILRDMSS